MGFIDRLRSVLKKVCLQNRVSLSLGKKAEGYLTLFNIYGNAHDEELFIKRAIVLEPTTLMPTCRVVVCPMYYTTFLFHEYSPLN